MRLVYLTILFLAFLPPLFPQKVTLTLISNKETQASAKEFAKIMEKYFPAVEVKTVAYKDSTQLRKKISFPRLPFGFFSQSLKKNDEVLFTLAFNRLIVPFKDYYIVNPEVFLRRGQRILDRKRIKGRLDIFSMGFCPGCQRSEYILASYLKKHFPDFSLHIRFVGRLNKEGQILSLHGEKEVVEDVVEKIIETHFPSHLLDYLIKKKDTLDYHKILADLGIKEETLKKYYPEAKQQVKNDIIFSDSLSIHSTPTFLWENVLITDNLSLIQRLLKDYIDNGKSVGK